MVANTGGVIGPNVDQVDTVQQFKLGTAILGDDNQTYTYVQAGGAIAAGQSDLTISAAFSATDGGGTNVGPAVAINSGEYFWATTATAEVAE